MATESEPVVDEASSKTLVRKIYGPELGEELALAAGHGKRKDYRGVLEPTGAVAQCQKAGKPYVKDMPCYLCGQPIPDKAMLSGPEDELYVECEHILPVTEGRWYLELYMATRPPEKTDAWTRRAIELEYEQAHRVCNQAKSNYSFLKETPDGIVQISEVGIKKILKNIQIRARKHIHDYPNAPELRTIMTAIANDVGNRVEAVRTRVQLILDHINHPAGTTPKEDVRNMALLLRTALVADPRTLPDAVRAVHDNWYKNTTVAQQTKTALVANFVDETYATYPEFRPETIRKLFTALPIPPELLAEVTAPAQIHAILRTFFETPSAPDLYGKTLLSTVFYGVYQQAIQRILATNTQTEQAIALVCELVSRASVVQMNEPRVPSILGPISIPANLKTRCEIAEKVSMRKARTEARELQSSLADILDEELPTASEDADYYLDGLQATIGKALRSTGVSPEDAKTLSKRWSKDAHAVFVETHPEGIDRARDETADQLRALILVSALKIGADLTSVADQVDQFVRTNRNDSATGGRRKRRRTRRARSKRPKAFTLRSRQR